MTIVFLRHAERMLLSVCRAQPIENVAQLSRSVVRERAHVSKLEPPFATRHSVDNSTHCKQTFGQ